MIANSSAELCTSCPITLIPVHLSCSEPTALGNDENDGRKIQKSGQVSGNEQKWRCFPCEPTGHERMSAGTENRMNACVCMYYIQTSLSSE